MIRRVVSNLNSGSEIEVGEMSRSGASEAVKDSALISIRSYDKEGRETSLSLALNKHRLGVLIEIMTIIHSRIEGDLKEKTLMVPAGSVITVDGVHIPND